MSHLSDIEIAQAKKLQHISKIANKLGVSEEDIEMYGKYKAKLPIELIDEEKALHKYAEKRLYEKRYFPWFFVFLLQKKE